MASKATPTATSAASAAATAAKATPTAAASAGSTKKGKATVRASPVIPASPPSPVSPVPPASSSPASPSSPAESITMTMSAISILLREISARVREIRAVFGRDVKSLDEIEERTKTLEYLRAQIELLEGVGAKLNEAESAEHKCIERYLAEEERKVAGARNALLKNKHADLSAPMSTSTSTDTGNGSGTGTAATTTEEHAPLRVESPPASNGKPDYVGPWAKVAKGGKVINKTGTGNNSGSPDIPVASATPMQFATRAPGIPGTTGATGTQGVPNARGRVMTAHVVAPGASISCVEIERVEDCVLPVNLGFLCWAKDKETFCMSVNGMIMKLPPGLPEIFQSGQTPKKNLPHKFLKPGQKVDPAFSEFYIPLNHTTGPADQPSLTNRNNYVPASYGIHRSYDYSFRLGDGDNFRDDVRDLNVDHPDFIYYECKVGCEVLTLLAAMTEFNRRRTKQ